MTFSGSLEFGFDPINAVEQFKKGSTPIEAVGFLNVGREAWHEGTVWYLDRFVQGERSAVRFVSGSYGAGKTHLLYLTAKEGLARDFVVSYVTAEQANLAKFELVYRDMVRSLRTRAMSESESLDFSTQTNGLRLILEEWFQHRLATAEALLDENDHDSESVIRAVKTSIDGLDEAKHWDANFRHAVQAYLKNRLSDMDESKEQNDAILRWFQGEALPRAETRAFGVYDQIRSSNSRDMFRSLTQMLKEFGYAGLVLLIDELERILVQTPKAREKAYQTVRQLLDNSDRAGATSCYILCAITPEVLKSKKGFTEYDALWERVKTAGTGMSKFVDKRAIVMDLELTPFDRAELLAMARKIRTLHSHAMGWEAERRVTDTVIEAYVERLLSYELEVSRPRVLVRTIAQLLEKSEQYPDYDPLRDVTDEISESVRILTSERAQAQSEW